MGRSESHREEVDSCRHMEHWDLTPSFKYVTFWPRGSAADGWRRPVRRVRGRAAGPRCRRRRSGCRPTCRGRTARRGEEDSPGEHDVPQPGQSQSEPSSWSYSVLRQVSLSYSVLRQVSLLRIKPNSKSRNPARHPDRGRDMFRARESRSPSREIRPSKPPRSRRLLSRRLSGRSDLPRGILSSLIPVKTKLTVYSDLPNLTLCLHFFQNRKSWPPLAVFDLPNSLGGF